MLTKKQQTNRGSIIMPSKGPDNWEYKWFVLGHITGKTSSFSYTALSPYCLGEGLLGPLRFLILLKGSSLKLRYKKKIDYTESLDCKQDSVYPEVMYPMVWRKPLFAFS